MASDAAQAHDPSVISAERPRGVEPRTAGAAASDSERVGRAVAVEQVGGGGGQMHKLRY